ncbi:putative reverse transcriptase domain-containing protein [Tanacetum coccineum]
MKQIKTVEMEMETIMGMEAMIQEVMGIEGAVGLAQWFEKMEYVFHISNCTVGCQVKYATCTLLGGALTWWNSHVRTVGHDASYGMTWKTLMKMMTENYYPRSEIKKPETELAYTVGPGEKREYAGTLPLCNKCKFHHNGSCVAKCTNCKRVGHLARDCRSPTTVNTQRALGAVQKTAGNGEAHERAYALGGGEPNPDSNIVTGTFLLNNRYASILFDTGADRSFVSTTFISLIDIAPSTLDNSYDVELADGRIT